MSVCDRAVTRLVRGAIGSVLFVALVAVAAEDAQAQQQNFGWGRSVGGIAIDANGLLTNATVADQAEMRRLALAAIEKVPDALNKTSKLRKVSLRRLDAAIQKALEGGGQLPDTILYLAGLQQIRYVLAYPEKKDIVLVGPGEGWRVDQRGNVVGASTGRPVMLLDDLLVALRSALSPNRAVITCSIDPTPEGLARLNRIAKQLTAADPQGAARMVEEQLGPQRISFTGVPESSHFARVLVAADYRMKRISMELEPAPIAGLPSFMQLMRGGRPGMQNMLPRWWLAPNYEPLLRDPEGMAWELRGAAVKALAENDYFNARGVRERVAPADPVSQRWADTFTRRYEDLAQAEPIFARLRNCMDLAIVGAIVASQDLMGKAGCALPMLTDGGALRSAELPAPRQVASKASLVHKARRWTIAAGGVEIDPWTMVRQAQISPQLGAARAEADSRSETTWWWD